ncbi:MAG: nuclear transport factor 2 family protein [Dehalococcoidia bacterium]
MTETELISATKRTHALLMRIVDAVNSKDLAALDEALGSGFVHHRGPVSTNRETYLALWRPFFEMAPAYRVQLVDLVESEASAAFRFIATGWPTEESKASAVWFMSLDDGRIVEAWETREQYPEPEA